MKISISKDIVYLGMRLFAAFSLLLSMYELKNMFRFVAELSNEFVISSLKWQLYLILFVLNLMIPSILKNKERQQIYEKSHGKEKL